MDRHRRHAVQRGAGGQLLPGPRGLHLQPAEQAGEGVSLGSVRPCLVFVNLDEFTVKQAGEFCGFVVFFAHDVASGMGMTGCGGKGIENGRGVRLAIIL